jgi:hypothetical protein
MVERSRLESIAVTPGKPLLARCVALDISQSPSLHNLDHLIVELTVLIGVEISSHNHASEVLGNILGSLGCADTTTAHPTATSAKVENVSRSFSSDYQLLPDFPEMFKQRRCDAEINQDAIGYPRHEWGAGRGRILTKLVQDKGQRHPYQFAKEYNTDH